MERFREYLLMLARSRIRPDLRGRIDPSDVVQQTLLISLDKAEAFRGSTDAQTAAWLRAILANEIGMALRRIGRHPGGPARSIEAQLDETSARLGSMLAADVTPPGLAMEKAEEAVRLASAMALLPEDQRTALELRHLDGLSVAEVARQMDRTLEAVAGLLYRATKKLRALMAEPHEE